MLSLEYGYTEDELDLWMHDDLANATENCYFRFYGGLASKSHVAKDLMSVHAEFVDSEYKEAAKDSWNAFVQFLKDRNS